jgi:hypothetical protein
VRDLRTGTFILRHCLVMAVLLGAAGSFVGRCAAEEYTFDLGEIEKKPYHFGGYAEVNPVLYRTDRDAALYRLNFYDRDEGSTLLKYGMTLQLEAGYEKGKVRGFARTSSRLDHTYEGWSGKTSLYEGFVSFSPSQSLRVDAGKKTLRWGTGYAWNPVAFFDRPKDPDDPALDLEGFFALTLDYIKSFDGVLKTFSFTPVLLPVYGDMNRDFGGSGHVNLGARLYFLLWDTDINFMFVAGGSRPSRYGMDFSRNITSNFEVHGELAWVGNSRKNLIDGGGRHLETRAGVWNWLVGIRYLSGRETTCIVEYFRNGEGFTEEETAAYFSYVEKGYDVFRRTGDDSLLRRASDLSKGAYGRMNPMRNYVYLRVSQKEPFDILYFTPALTCILNVDDRSLSVSPELVYTGVDNLELRLKGSALIGDRFTEYGEKQNDYRVELRARYYF